MKTYDIDGIKGDAQTVVAELHKSSRAPAIDDETWMRETAERVEIMNGIRVRYDNPEEFLDDMLDTGLFQRLDEAEEEDDPKTRLED